MSNYNLARKFVKEKAKYLARIQVRDQGVLRRKLVNTLIDYTIERYDLTAIEGLKLTKVVNLIVLSNLGDFKTSNPDYKNLPKDWAYVIKQRPRLYSLKQLTPVEITYHRNYCSIEDGCRFGPRETCPVAKGWLSPVERKKK